MLLKSLSIKDFRLFKGNHKIAFATDSNRNVTMIMGDNGTGKTTLAQVFSWCLYGDTTFEDKILLCKSTSAAMLPNAEENVHAELTLVHGEKEYNIISDQKYKKNSNGIINPLGQRSFTIALKKSDGNLDYVKPLDTEIRMKEILPKELSKYFFFDGERIESISKEIKRGRSQEFAGAVQSLLGLSAYRSALSHLKSRGRNNVLYLYQQSYDARTDSKIAEFSSRIIELTEKIETIDARLVEIAAEQVIAKDNVTDLTERIAKNQDSEELARQKAELVCKCDSLRPSRTSQIKSLLSTFSSSAPSYFAKRLMKDALVALSKADKIDKGVPNVNDKTIQFLIDRKKCICGAEVETGSDSFIELTKLLEFIPPKSIGSMIAEFVGACEISSKSVQHYYSSFCESYKRIREFEENSLEYQEKIHKIEKQLEGLESVGGLQAELSRYEKLSNGLDGDIARLNQEKGGHLTKQKDLEAERKELANKDSNNRRIETYKAYAQYMFDSLSAEYEKEESRMRTELQETVNELFQKIYSGGFSISLDEKYNIQINAIDQVAGLAVDVETSTSQSISVIFAFIAGVIRLARKHHDADNSIVLTEPYPLVMDAPLSAFDTKRIETVCKVLPSVAEQVIILIKDTDGNLADAHLVSKVGKRYRFDKKNEFESHIV